MRLEHRRQLLAQTMPVEEKLLVVEAKEMKNRGMPILDTDLVVGSGQSNFICRSINDATFDASPGHPSHHRVLVMIAPGLAHVFVARQLSDGQPAKLPAPNHQSAVKQTALFQ